MNTEAGSAYDAFTHMENTQEQEIAHNIAILAAIGEGARSTKKDVRDLPEGGYRLYVKLAHGYSRIDVTKRGFCGVSGSYEKVPKGALILEVKKQA